MDGIFEKVRCAACGKFVMEVGRRCDMNGSERFYQCRCGEEFSIFDPNYGEDWLVADEEDEVHDYWPEHEDQVDLHAEMLWDDWYDLGKACREEGVPGWDLEREFASLYDTDEEWWRCTPTNRKLAWEGFRAGYSAPPPSYAA